MLSLIYTLIKYALEYKSAKDNTDYINDINNVVARIENANETVAEDECVNTGDCYYKTGYVTFIEANYVLVDNQYKCDIVNVLVNNLKVGDHVYYSVLQKNQGEDHKVKRIMSVIDESWDNTNIKSQKDTTKIQTMKKNIIGKVTGRKSRWIFVEPNNISVDLNKVHSEFVPIIGDWLKLESVVEVNENSTDFSGKLLEISKIQPLRSKLNIGTITSYDTAQEFGVIEKNVIFNRGTCDSGYIPSVGDKVVSESIESDQGFYTWRSLTVVPIMKVSNKKIELPTLYTSQITKNNLDELVKNKFGIVITNNLNIDLNVHEEKILTVDIRNTSAAIHVLRKGCFTCTKALSQLTLIQPNTPEAASILNPFNTVSYVFMCKAKFVGTSEELFTFNFQGFDIGRIFRITVNPAYTIAGTYPRNNNIIKYNKSVYAPAVDDFNQLTYIPGIRPYNPPAFIKVRNITFRVPQHYWKLVLQCVHEKKTQIESEQDVGNAIPCLSNRLSFTSYKDRFHALLYLEEIAQVINMQQYDMESVTMRHYKEYLVMQVPGLAEKRPSYLVGDRAVVSFKWDNSQGKLKHEGFIHKVTKSEIFLKFNKAFHEEYNNEHCQVTFKCSQSAIQRCHNAINIAVDRLGSNFLFPTHVIEKEPQLYLEETDKECKPSCIQTKSSSHQRSNSLSSESSCTNSAFISNTSSNSTNKSFTKVSVVERLFNVKPIDPHTDAITNSGSRVDNGQNVEENLMNCLTLKGNNLTDVLSPLKTSNTVSSTHHDNAELEPYVSQGKKRKLVWFNKNLNYYQKEAVRNVLKGHARPLPYVIFGPPGTGKTVTLCETILQILSLIPESRLLVATPSNSSANLIAERLLDSGILKPGDMVRLIAHHYLGNDSIPEKLLPYCATAELGEEGTTERIRHSGSGPRINCSMSVLGRHRITIGTCIALGILHNMGFPCGHFSHVLVDEAGQATEPEIMIPLNFIHADYGQVVLAGDPLQLGPVVQSRLAKNFGLEESFLTRLLRHFPYQKDPSGFETHYDPRLVTKLVMNYRSLPELLELSSSLFYDSELQAQISSKHSKEAELLQTLATELPERKGLPPSVIFHGVNGENCKDADSPSWYNPEEATQVYLYLLKLYKFGLSANDIGIITPYQKQVFQIRDLLLELDIKLPKISSVEGFQGQERQVIILSTVRSCNTYINEDIKHALGFVACPRRLNVAITRARALLIILGNPKLLVQDPYWKSVLIYCIDKGAYTGCTFLFANIEDTQTEVDDSFVVNDSNNVL